VVTELAQRYGRTPAQIHLTPELNWERLEHDADPSSEAMTSKV
jgi:hypothetical protein